MLNIVEQINFHLHQKKFGKIVSWFIIRSNFINVVKLRENQRSITDETDLSATQILTKEPNRNRSDPTKVPFQL